MHEKKKSEKRGPGVFVRGLGKLETHPISQDASCSTVKLPPKTLRNMDAD